MSVAMWRNVLPNMLSTSTMEIMVVLPVVDNCVSESENTNPRVPVAFCLDENTPSCTHVIATSRPMGPLP